MHTLAKLHAAVIRRQASSIINALTQVCHSWKRAVDQGLLRLQSDSAWDNNQLSKVQRTFPSLAVLDLHLSVKTSVPEPLQHMKSLRHLRICKNSHLAQAEWTRTLAKLRQLHTLALPGCRSPLTHCSYLEHSISACLAPSLSRTPGYFCRNHPKSSMMYRTPSAKSTSNLHREFQLKRSLHSIVQLLKPDKD